MNAIAFDNSYARLPGDFYSRLPPTPVEKPTLVSVNHLLARQLGIDPDWLSSEEGVEVLAGNTVPEGAEPLASVYAGHQFGSYNPRLGDGRAILLGEVLDETGRRFDIQLKGSGPTPYSRGGDGRSPVGPVLREYIVSEAMYSLGIPTTRALAAVTTGEQVVRDRFLPGAVLTRVASSHIRIGTFQFFAAQQDIEALGQLTRHVMVRHYPESLSSDNQALSLLEGVIRRQAELIASWQALGFIHGVMNTDNMLLSGETIDYGPCAFMDHFVADKVFSSIDHGGRYAYRNQPGIAHWNLACLARCLLPLLHDDQEQAVELAQNAINSFPDLFQQAHGQAMARKLGLEALGEEDDSLVEDLFKQMAEHRMDFTLTFRYLADLADETSGEQNKIGGLFQLPDSMLPWLARWKQRISTDSSAARNRQSRMYAANPVFIPRNHLVEEAIAAATDSEDFDPFFKLIDVLRRPYEYCSDQERYAQPPRPEQEVRQTFCGT